MLEGIEVFSLFIWEALQKFYEDYVRRDERLRSSAAGFSCWDGLTIETRIHWH